MQPFNYLNIFCDGASRGNPGPAASAFIVQDEHGQVIHQQGEYLGTATNNVAEYRAVTLSLNWLRDQSETRSQKLKKIEIILDSQLLHRQIIGQYRVKSPHLKSLLLQIKALIEDLRDKNIILQFSHVLRESNNLADKLANQILDQHQEISNNDRE